MGFAVLGFSVPVFVVGYLLIFLFAIKLRWLPVQGYNAAGRGRAALAPQPRAAVGDAGPGLCRPDRRITRATMLDVTAEDYIRTAGPRRI